METSRVDLLVCFRQSKVIPGKVVDSLDKNWALLGTNNICEFVGLFSSPKPDNDIVFGSGPYSFLKGMIISCQSRQTSILEETMNQLSLVSAEISVFNKTLEAIKKSTRLAESTWKTQSSLISEYQAKLEALTKTATTTHEEITTRKKDQPSRSSPPRCQDPFFPFYYEVDSHTNELMLKVHGTPTDNQLSIISTMQAIIECMPEDEFITKLNPINFCARLDRNMRALGNRDPMRIARHIIKDEKSKYQSDTSTNRQAM